MFRTLAFLFVALSATVCRADTILYFNDFLLGTDRMAQALTSLSGQHTVTTASSIADFTTKIQSGNYTLGILFQQNFSGLPYDQAFQALQAHVADGGLAIVADWSRNNANVNPFGAAYTGINNQNSMTITDPSLATGIINPVGLTNPGWTVFSTGLSGGNLAATFANGQGAIVTGNGGRTIVNGFLSDTFTNGAQGTQLYVNQINSVFDAISEVPEPASLIVWSAIAGVGLITGARRRRTRLQSKS